MPVSGRFRILRAHFIHLLGASLRTSAHSGHQLRFSAKMSAAHKSAGNWRKRAFRRGEFPCNLPSQPPCRRSCAQCHEIHRRPWRSPSRARCRVRRADGPPFRCPVQWRRNAGLGSLRHRQYRAVSGHNQGRTPVGGPLGPTRFYGERRPVETDRVRANQPVFSVWPKIAVVGRKSHFRATWRTLPY
jgi:hypothetical protein